MNKTGAEDPGRPPGCIALILWCCSAVTHLHTEVNCRSRLQPAAPGIHVWEAQVSGRRLSQAARQGEPLSIKLLFYWLPNWPWNHGTEPRSFSCWAEQDLLVSNKKHKHTTTRARPPSANRPYWFFICVEASHQNSKSVFSCLSLFNLISFFYLPRLSSPSCHSLPEEVLILSHDLHQQMEVAML